MRFCQINTTVVQSRSIKMGWLWTKRDFVARKTYLKFPQNFLVRAVNICDMHISDVPECLWTCWEKLTLYQSFVSEHQIFLFENCCLGKKRRSKVVGAFRKFGGWGAQTFSDRYKSTFTWDPKWTQTGLKSQTALKCRSIYMAIYIEISLGYLSKQ